MVQAKVAMMSIAPNSSGSKARRGKKKAPNQVAVNNAKGKKKQRGDKKQTGKCFKCGEKGHWKPDCPKKGKATGMHHALVVESCLASTSTHTWVIDTGATDHICFDPDLMQVTRRLYDGEIEVQVGDATKVAAVAVGDVYLRFSSDRFLILKNVLLIPSFRRNLISVSKLSYDGYSISFNDNCVIKKDGSYICRGIMENNLYTITSTQFNQRKSELNATSKISKKRKEPSTSMNETYLWHLRLGHANERRIHAMVDQDLIKGLEKEPFSKCESCLEGKMTKRSFRSKGNRAKEVLELIHTDVCGPMSTEARGGFRYFVTFTDDYSKIGYIYLMRYKSETFDKFKEFKAKVETQHGKSIKCLRSDRGGEYLSAEFLDYLSVAGIESQTTAPGTPQQNGVAERRNRTLLNMVRSMMSYARLPVSFWGHALLSASHILDNLPSKSVPTTPYELWNGRKPNLEHLRVWGCPAHVLEKDPTKLESRTEVCVFIGYPRGTKAYEFYSLRDQKVIVSTHATFLEEDYVMNHKSSSEIALEELTQVSTSINQEQLPSVTTIPETSTNTPDIVVPRRSGRVSHEPDRYIGLGECMDHSSDSNVLDPWNFAEAQADVDHCEWVKAIDSELQSMLDKDVYDLSVLPEGCTAIGSKWIYKRKRGPDGRVKVFKARLVAKGYTQKEGIDYDETFSPVAMLKSIRILLSIAAYMDWEVWQMDVKTAFLNGSLEETIYMEQPEGYVVKGKEHMVWKLKKAIYGLKQASRSWNQCFDQTVQKFGFEKCPNESCVYKKVEKGNVVFLVLYVDDILLIGNNKKMLSSVRTWLSSQFEMKDMGDAGHILGIKVLRNRGKKMLCLSQESYIDTVLRRFSMQDAKKGFLPFRHGIHLSQEMCPKTASEIAEMRRIPYASAVGSLMYAMLCTRPDICFAVGMVARYQSNPGQGHWTAVKNILKYLNRTKDYVLVYNAAELCPLGYTDSDFQADVDSRKSTSGYVFTLGGGAIVWKSVKQKCIADSTMEAEYVAASEAAKEAVWLKNFLLDLGVVTNMPKRITVYCDNSGAVANSREPRAHKASKHIERKYHIIRDIVQRGDIQVVKIESENNLADPFTKALAVKPYESHVEGMGVRLIQDLNPLSV